MERQNGSILALKRLSLLRTFHDKHLWDCVLVYLHFLGGLPGHIEGDDVRHPLDFMDDGIGVGHVFSVAQAWLSRWTNHSVYLGVDFL